MSRFSRAVLSVILVFGASARLAFAAIIDTVAVGIPGNAPDTRYDPSGYGAVSYAFEMGKFEVTAGQYTEFLNAVARTDTYHLYNWQQGDPSPPHWGSNIHRFGSPGSYSYSVAADWADRPVNYVSWGDAARFCNWLTNGQSTGTQGPDTTEDGSYLLDGAVTGSGLNSVTRKATARFVIPTEDEWYKAAYFDPRPPTGQAYWDFPTGTNALPSNILTSPDPGNSANFYNGSTTIGPPYYRTEVGAFTNSASPSGTFDQGGNVWEWNEAVIDGLYRGVRGGSFNWDVSSLSAANRSLQVPDDDDVSIGFRVAEVPEPASLAILAIVGTRWGLRCERRSRLDRQSMVPNA